MTRGVPVAFLLLLAALPRPLAAQPRDDVAAEALFVDGRKLMAKKQFAEAVEKFSASDRAAPSVGARLNLGDCYLKLGKTASAWGAYRSAANLAARNQDARRAAVAEKRASALEPKLSYLLIAVPKAAQRSGLEVLWDDAPRSSALWGERFPVDPGKHAIEARAPGYESWKKAISIMGAGETKVSIPELSRPHPTTTEPTPPPRDGRTKPGETARNPEPTPTTRTTRKPIAPNSPPGSDESSSLTQGRKLALAIGGVAVIALGAGSVMGLTARSTWKDAKTNCDSQLRCNSEGLELADKAGSRADQATIAFAVAGGAAAVAAILWLRFAPEKGSDGATTVSATVAPGLAGVSVGGRF